MGSWYHSVGGTIVRDEEEWERLEQILDMTAEEWEAEVREVNQDDEELNLEEDDEEQLDAEPGVSGISRFP